MVTAALRTPADPAAKRTEDLVRAFGEDGFVHLPRFFSEQEVTQLRAAAVDAMSAEDATRKTAEAGIVTTVDGWEHNDTLRGLALHPRLGALAEQLAGMPLRVWLSTLLVKQAGDNRPTMLHDDVTGEEFNSRISLNAWVALVDIPVERGCLTFLPRSHRREGPERIDITDLNMADDKADDAARSYLFTYWPGLRWSPRVTVPVRAGDVTFHHNRIAHLAGANQTEDDRIALGVVYTDADATYQPLPGYDLLPYQPGQPLPDDRFPRVGVPGRATGLPAVTSPCQGLSCDAGVEGLGA